MLDEFKKSINSVLYERMTSPLYGAFVFSWFLWNWQIPYVTLFISENTLTVSKINYIESLYSFSYFLVYPTLSTLLLLTIVPFVSNGAYWLSLKFENWRYSKKNEVEGKQLLSLEKSLEIRSQIESQNEKFIVLLKSRDEEIDMLKKQVESIHSYYTNIEVGERGTRKNRDENYLKDYQNFRNAPYFSDFDRVIEYVQGSYKMVGDIPTPVISYYEANDIINKVSKTGVYDFTPKGRIYYRQYVNENP